MAADFTINFKDGLKWTKDQKLRLGTVVADDRGGRWSYVQLQANVGVGEVVQDTMGSDLLSAATSTITTAQTVGSKKLVDSGEFGAADDKLLVGALGQINGHADGQAQAFHVKRWVDDNTLEVELIMDRDGYAGGGWSIALTTNSVYTLWFPGYVKKSAGGPTGMIRGVAQAAGSKGEYGYVKQSNLGWVKMDVSATALTAGEAVVATGSGLAKGFDDGYASNVINEHPTEIIGRAPFGDITGSTDRLSLIYLTIENDAESYRDVGRSYAMNLVDVKGS